MLNILFQCIVCATVIGLDDAFGSHYSAQLRSLENVLTDAVKLQVCSCVILHQSSDDSLLSWVHVILPCVFSIPSVHIDQLLLS